MDSHARHRQVSRQRPTDSSSKAASGSRQICLKMDQTTYDDIWNDAGKVRKFVEQKIQEHPEIFPEEISEGFPLSGHFLSKHSPKGWKSGRAGGGVMPRAWG